MCRYGKEGARNFSLVSLTPNDNNVHSTHVQSGHTQCSNSTLLCYQLSEVVQYVVQAFPKCEIENLVGEGNLLLILPTNLAVRVARSHCSATLTLKHVPSLMATGIAPQKVLTSYNI